MKMCTTCQVDKSEDQFPREGDRLRTQCRPCRNAYKSSNRRKLRASQPREVWGRADRSYHLRKNYGLTLEAFDALLETQNGGCAVCGGPSGGRNFHVDHDHLCCAVKPTCGRCVRGLLCSPCNTALAMVADDPERLEMLKVYLTGVAT